MKVNVELDTEKIANDIWVLKYWYLSLIKDTLDSQNRITLDRINISDSNKRSLEAFLKRKWFIGKFKLKWDSKKILYFNPLYAHSWKTISKELYNAFDDINNKVY